MDKGQWPALEGQRFIRGRPASLQDVEAGNAAFVLQTDGRPIGSALDITIPQYAYFTDTESGSRTPCIVIQAEQASGKEYVGAYDFREDSHIVGFLGDFALLGAEQPEMDC